MKEITKLEILHIITNIVTTLAFVEGFFIGAAIKVSYESLYGWFKLIAILWVIADAIAICVGAILSVKISCDIDELRRKELKSK